MGNYRIQYTFSDCGLPSPRPPRLLLPRTRWLPLHSVTPLSPSGVISLRNILVDSSEVTKHLYSVHSDNNTAAFRNTGKHITDLRTKIQTDKLIQGGLSGLSLRINKQSHTIPRGYSDNMVKESGWRDFLICAQRSFDFSSLVRSAGKRGRTKSPINLDFS